MYVRAHIVKSDGTKLTSSDDVSTTNGWLNSLFSNLEISINGVLIPSKNNYSYLAYLLSHLTYSADLKKSELQSTNYFIDDDPADLSETNKSFQSRAKTVLASKEAELYGPLFHDLFLQDRAILPGLDIKISLQRTKPEFNLLTTTKDLRLKLIIDECSLHVKLLTVRSDVLSLHSALLAKGQTAKYPHIYNIVKTFAIPSSTQNIINETLFSQTNIPHRIVLGFVTSASYLGSLETNPFNFGKHGLTSITVTADSDLTGSNTLSLNFTAHKYMQAYASLLDGLNVNFSKSLGITPNAFVSGNAFYCFQLSPFDCVSGVRIHVNFEKALTESLTCIVLAQSHATLLIDKDNNIELKSE